MVIISDIENIFTGVGAPSNFVFNEVSTENEIEAFTIHGVYSIDYSQANKIPSFPLEGGSFSQDSQNVDPYKITISGVIVAETEPALSISAQLVKIRGYLNGTTLLKIANAYCPEAYGSLKLSGISYKTSVEATVPQITLVFTQIQSSASTNYNPSNSENKKPLNTQ